MSSFISNLKEGHLYIKLWPLRNELAPLFIENRVILTTQFALKVMPIIATIIIFFRIFLNKLLGYPLLEGLSISIGLAIFTLSLPLQGLWWLGNRSQTQLPINLHRWYLELYLMLDQAGVAQESQPTKPCYKHLAKILNITFKRLERQCIERWF